jgi:hypothetical protein
VRRRAPESLVEDVVSETFLVCWRRFDRVPDEPLPWLYAVARYAARRADGDYCFAIESKVAKGVGCDLNGGFPSPARPVMVFPPLVQFAGLAADGVATVRGIDSSGNTVVSAPVSQNLFASTTPGPFPTIVAIEALDAQGNVLATERRPGR